MLQEKDIQNIFRIINVLKSKGMGIIYISHRLDEIFLLDEPTRGIDIGAKFEIYTLIHELAQQGKAVILVSPEMEELIGLCNRIYIMYDGQIMDEVEGERRTQDVIINSLLGVK